MVLTVLWVCVRDHECLPSTPAATDMWGQRLLYPTRQRCMIDEPNTKRDHVMFIRILQENVRRHCLLSLLYLYSFCLLFFLMPFRFIRSFPVHSFSSFTLLKRIIILQNQNPPSEQTAGRRHCHCRECCNSRQEHRIGRQQAGDTVMEAATVEAGRRGGKWMCWRTVETEG